MNTLIGLPTLDHYFNPRTHLSSPGVKRLYRDTRNKVVCGICSGLAEYAGVDPVIVRLATVFLLLLAPFPTLVLYLAGCILIPEKPSSRALSILYCCFCSCFLTLLFKVPVFKFFDQFSTGPGSW